MLCFPLNSSYLLLPLSSHSSSMSIMSLVPKFSLYYSILKIFYFGMVFSSSTILYVWQTFTFISQKDFLKSSTYIDNFASERRDTRTVLFIFILLSPLLTIDVVLIQLTKRYHQNWLIIMPHRSEFTVFSNF